VAARDAGLEIGGWCPPGGAAEDGRIPDEFPLRETPEDRSPAAPETPRSLRTEWNVRDADATLILRPKAIGVDDPGTDWTREAARLHGRPVLVCDPENEGARGVIAEWLRAHEIETLNVAGPAESAAPGVGAKVYHLLAAALVT